ncbi:efflux RND transporter periplasmic adaptor subunit [Salinimonas sp. HHU 13199]|uniref:Efflux RND transporter periplasmic adaptor subunit n=1 Tax=Salinimonas profundi TaxID=2729140 RepID=A0ABR8LPQ4_9ALTE|nr:efflux RND transporter periplasmic adaptor subunit [Salinimonas profundi]MBD3586084.1 efflux RND transporter periplasmic adaptor subunit [Salinimonas profundi]
MHTFIRVSIVIFGLIALSACNSEPSTHSQAQAQSQGVPVDVATVVARPITEWDTFTGRLEAPESVALRPRVSGYIEMVTFEEGQYVNRGDTLFLIDNRQFKAEVDRLTAQLDEAKSRLKLAKQDLARAEGLRRSQSVSQEVLDTRAASVDQARAAVAQTTAALDQARLNRGFARVEAPISGKISRANITQGNFVTAGQSILTTIVATDRLYAYFDIDETTWLNYQKNASNAQTVDDKPVAMRLANEDVFGHWGNINFVDNQVNGGTGTLRVRAVFANDENQLLPGLFAHLKLAGEHQEEGILIAEKAIGTDLNNKYVLVVDSDKKVQYRAVTLGDKVGSLRIIEAGLQPDDTIVVDGLQRVRPGTPVTPNKVDMADDDTLQSLNAWQQQLDRNNDLARVSADQIAGTR